MKSKTIFSLLGIILLLGMVVAGGLALSQREAKLTETQKDALLAKGITDIKSTTMKCNDDYCTFWITKENAINSERRIEKYKEVCDNRTKICSQVLKDEKELLDERIAITDKAISSLADSMIVDAGKGRDNPDVGTDEEVLIGAKPK